MSLTAEQVRIYNLIYEDGALQNYHGPSIELLQDAIAGNRTYFQTATEPAGWLPTDMDDIDDQLEVLEGVLSDFKAHTDRLSGVTFLTAGASSEPDVQQLLGVANARQRLHLDLGATEGIALSLAQELFGSLYDITFNDFAAIVGYTSNIQNLVNAPGGPATDPITIQQNLDGFANRLTAQMSADNAAYNTAIQELRIQALTYNLTPTDTIPDSVIDIVVDQRIATDLLLDLIDIIESQED